MKRYIKFFKEEFLEKEINDFINIMNKIIVKFNNFDESKVNKIYDNFIQKMHNHEIDHRMINIIENLLGRVEIINSSNKIEIIRSLNKYDTREEIQLNLIATTFFLNKIYNSI